MNAETLFSRNLYSVNDIYYVLCIVCEVYNRRYKINIIIRHGKILILVLNSKICIEKCRTRYNNYYTHFFGIYIIIIIIITIIFVSRLV